MTKHFATIEARLQAHPTKRYVIFGGAHNYQPNRADPWRAPKLRISPQETAYPNRNWNERIAQEVPLPATQARVLKGGMVSGVYNNYAFGSFDFGPAWLTWLAKEHSGTYRRILAADACSAEYNTVNGVPHGNAAMLGSPAHVILPLCNDPDLDTQVRAAVAHFRYTYGREPETAFLPEAAVDIRSLEKLAEFGITSTILRRGQARRFRWIDGGKWQDAGFDGTSLDDREAYRVNLPSGRHMNVVFYNNNLGIFCSFERGLQNAPQLLDRIQQTFSQMPRDHRWWQSGSMANWLAITNRKATCA